MMYENNKYFKQARKELEYLSGDKDFQEIVEKRALALMDQEVQTRLAKEEGREEGKEEGREEGRRAGKTEGISIGEKKKEIEIAKKMKARNIPIEEIMELTELSKEEIEKIKIEK